MAEPFKSTDYDRQYYEEREVHSERWKPYNDSVALALADTLGPTRVLDVGCGVGNLVKSFLDAGVADANGLDISKAAVEMSHVTEKLAVCDVTRERFPFDDDTFDLVTSFEFVEHIPDEGVRHVYQEIARVLKRGGHYFQQTPVPGSAAAKIDPTHVNVKNRRGWLKLAREYGFLPDEKGFYAMEHRFPKGTFGQKAPRFIREFPLLKWYVVAMGTRTLFKLDKKPGAPKEATA